MGGGICIQQEKLVIFKNLLRLNVLNKTVSCNIQCNHFDKEDLAYNELAWHPIYKTELSYNTQVYLVAYYIMDGHAIVVVKDINLLFYHGNAVILTLW